MLEPLSSYKSYGRVRMIIPPWIEVAKSLIGTAECAGSENNPKIIAWAKTIGGDIENSYVADSIPWCGLYTTHCFVDSGIKPVEGSLWALNWARFGTKLKEPCFGCVMSFQRTGGGHVGFYMSEDATHYHILGGNQSDAVNITRVAKSQFVSANWPKGYEKFMTPGRIKKEFDGKIPTATKLV